MSTTDHSLADPLRPDAERAEHYRRQLQTVAENATLALFIMDEHQHCTYMNRAAEQLTGFRLEQVQGKPLHNIIHHTRPDGTHYPLEECPIDQAFPQNMREQGEEVFVHPDGHFYPVSFTASPIRDGDRTVGTIIEVRDITDEKREQAERQALLRALEEERGKLSTVFHHAPALIAVLRGADHVFELANPSYQELVGRFDLIGRTLLDALPELAGQGIIDLLDQAYETGEPFVGTEVPIRFRSSPDGPMEERFFNFVYQPLAGAFGQERGILVHGVDVTEAVQARRRVEEQAAELESQTEELQQVNSELAARTHTAELAGRDAATANALLDAFFQTAPVAAGLVDQGLRYRRMNDTLAAIDGVRAEDALGKTIRDVVPHSADIVEPYYRQVFETGQPIRHLEVEGPRPTDPSTRGHYLVNYFPVRTDEAEMIGVGVVALDITEQREAEEARREEARIIETLHRVGHSLAAELDQQKIVQEVTDAATSLTGAQFGAFFYNVVNERGELLSLYTVSGVPREEFSRFPMPRNTPVFAATFHGTGAVRSDDITQDPRYGQMAPHHGMPKGHLPVTSYLAVPVISRSGEVIGGLFFGHKDPGVFKERHERLAVGIAGWAAVAMDNARLYDAEHQARAEAERANRAKSDFLATMSHELRTPLNAVLGYTELLLQGVPDHIEEGPRQKVQRIALSARHLLELIEEILTFSRLEAGEERVEPEPIAVDELVEEIQALTEPLALAKQIRFECHAPTSGIHMESDARKIRQILLNLLGNAIKFTDEGSIGISLEQVGTEVIFRVRDTGPGIAAEHMEQIFEPFYQVQGGSTRTAGGTGLGLSVSRRLARLMGGEITASSTTGEGSVFEVRLPTEAPKPV